MLYGGPLLYMIVQCVCSLSNDYACSAPRKVYDMEGGTGSRFCCDKIL